MKVYNHTIKGVTNRIVTPISIDVSDYPTNGESETHIDNLRTLWDTGASVTVISEDLVKRLALTPRDVTKVSGFDGKTITTNTYKIDLMFNDICIEFVDTIEAPLLHSDILLGMNVIGLGDLHVVHPSYKTTQITFELD